MAMAQSLQGFDEISKEFVSIEQAKSLIDEFEEEKWYWEGFATKRRVQRYNANDELPPLLQSLSDRLVDSTLLQRPHEVVVEEHIAATTESSVQEEEMLTIFESSSSCSCTYRNKNNGCDCYVGQLILVENDIRNDVDVSQVFHLPVEERRADCWHLLNCAQVTMEPNSLYLKHKASLWEWRSCMSVTSENNNGRVILIKFLRLGSAKKLPDHSKNEGSTMAATTTQMSQASIKSNGDTEQQNESHYEMSGQPPMSTTTATPPPRPCPPLQELLTIIITTSPIKSHPSTELLERTMETFGLGGDEFSNCPKVIICDGIRVLSEDSTTVSKKHSNVKQALRNGIAPSAKYANNYQEFKERLKEKCNAGKSPFINCRVVELEERHGYGFALREALRHHVQTKYVCVIQHDRTFMRPTPMKQVVRAMHNNSGIKYVGMSMRSNLLYGDIFLSKYGKAAYDELCDMMLYPPELLLDKIKWGPDSESTDKMMFSTKKLQDNIMDLAKHYKKSMQYSQQRQHGGVDKHQLSLTPTLFWYDNTHVCETAHYRDFIFEPKYKMVARGGFVEDKLSPVIAKSAQRLGLMEGHGKFGCYLLDDHSGMFFTGHLDGGSYLTQAERQEFVTNKS